MKLEIFKFEKVTSTNDAAINLIKYKQKETGCVLANIQTKGRGTHGNKWISEMGNFFGSIFFPLNKNYPTFGEFSIINPVIVYEIIKNFCGDKHISFKWPNDVFVNGRKICGILQEVITYNSKRFLIIGIGINIISNPDINTNYKATNILLETKKELTTIEIIDLLIKSYENFFYNLNTYNFINFKTKADLISEKK
tara:strand:- start:1043 stop:1630 length:588 start_codon:yes stop_codon:yes gene_type:complete